MDKIIVLDFGSQYNQLIARNIREIGVYSEVLPYNIDLNTIKNDPEVKGVILSGGPGSVYDENAFKIDKSIFDLNVPILGICYGMQVIHHLLYGEVQASSTREYGKTVISVDVSTEIAKNTKKEQTVWMSHGDRVVQVAPGFEVIARSTHTIALAQHEMRKIYTMQFHPEVTHTECGTTYLSNFVLNICQAKQEWYIEDAIPQMVADIKKKVGKDSVILGLSGGVDSSVCARLIHQAIGKQLTCIFIDTGLMRKNEGNQVMNIYKKHFKMNVVRINATARFLRALKGVTDPEEKRKIVGVEFVRTFETEKAKYKQAKFLAQGTIYPDIIESTSVCGPSHTIKSHHNVGGLPENIDFELLEPLRHLFKDEVRKLGVRLGIPRDIIYRHPFPGPGLAVRILGEVTAEAVHILQQADDIFIKELVKENLYSQVAQAFAILLPIKSVGVAGDKRTYERVCILRSVNTTDFMTAQATPLTFAFLEQVSCRIVNEVKGINRVAYDVTSKPPGTIEWE